ncbi:Fe(3+)-hydroxamate ABC transporter permease FhuB [Bacillus cereus group sp. N34]|uniref:Fe(3+)-hydroxamate ABC transporter permease FhuB n=1 Tax=Bacillus cereus group sp. N34 TaxID=2794595 RepID=UPI0018F4E1D5|nr:Fe(3+)-hydroxamate ABC transporter permease FhuB [Bacillus cereus group sp. N34]MBJ8018838.1 Fe(3+)-hydroxamate ABC transporter permease FhuB [Bacillus cereus group sp. N34]
MNSLQHTLRASLVFGGGAALLLLLFFIHIGQGQANISYSMIIDALISPNQSLEHQTLITLRLPRAVIAILAGGALAASGVILQTLTENPLAESSTMGIHSGAYFFLVAATIFLPKGLQINSLLFTFIGGAITALFVYRISGGKKGTPLRMALAGMVVTLMLSAFTGTMQLFYENETAGLFLWGAGSLIQNNWDGVQFAFPFIIISFLVLLFMSRKLNVLLLGDDVAVSLGEKTAVTRFIAFIAAIFLTAVIVTVVGPIGFVGLVAPHLMRLIGYRQHFTLLLSSFLWGAVLLLGADVVGRLIDPTGAELPVGAVTAMIGSPWLIYLVYRMMKSKQYMNDNGANAAGASSRYYSYKKVIIISITLCIVTIALGVTIGSNAYIESITNVISGQLTQFDKNMMMNLRLPRMLVAAIAGACLAISGLVFQGILRNPLADPSIIGISSGAGVGALTIMYVFPALPGFFLPIGAFIGGLLAVGIVLFFSWKSGFSPTALALIGIGISALGSAIIQIFIVRANLNVAAALTWLSGSTYARGWNHLENIILYPSLILIPIIFFLMKQLDVLVLGDDLATGLGQPVNKTRLALIVLATLLASINIAAVGTIAFLGLVAPHLARIVVGMNHQRLFVCSALFGAILLSIADLLGRTIAYPKEIPSGLVVAVLGAPYFLWLMRKSGKKVG